MLVEWIRKHIQVYGDLANERNMVESNDNRSLINAVQHFTLLHSLGFDVGETLRRFLKIENVKTATPYPEFGALQDDEKLKSVQTITFNVKLKPRLISNYIFGLEDGRKSNGKNILDAQTSRGKIVAGNNI